MSEKDDVMKKSELPTIRVSDHNHARVRGYAAEHNKSMSEVADDAIEEYFEGRDRKRTHHPHLEGPLPVTADVENKIVQVLDKIEDGTVRSAVLTDLYIAFK